MEPAVNSMIEFKQIVGRGTRLFDGKDYFTIYDFVKAYEHFNDPEWDGEPVDPIPSTPRGGSSEGEPREPTDGKGGEDEPTPTPQKIKIKLADGGGLALIVHPKGSKTWVWRYRVDGKQREMTLGSYPSVGLKDARQRVEVQRNLLDTNIPPDVAEMRAGVQARSGLTDTTFAGVARAWLAEERPHWAEKTYVRARNRIEKDATA